MGAILSVLKTWWRVYKLCVVLPAAALIPVTLEALLQGILGAFPTDTDSSQVSELPTK